MDNLTEGEGGARAHFCTWSGNGNKNYGSTIAANGATWTLAIPILYFQSTIIIM